MFIIIRPIAIILGIWVLWLIWLQITRSPKKKPVWMLAASTVLCVLAVVFWAGWWRPEFISRKILDYAYIKKCERLIARIEDYRKVHGKLPRKYDWVALGLDEKTDSHHQLYYGITEKGYQVCYSLGFDEFECFDSTTKKWSFEK